MTPGMVPLKRVASVSAGQSPPSEAVSDGQDGLPFLQASAEFGERYPIPKSSCDSAPKRCLKGDILLSVRAPVGALNVADRAYGIGRGLCAITPKSIDPEFLWWSLLASIDALRSDATGSTYEAVAAEDVESLWLPHMSPADQVLVARFLSPRVERIDQLVAVHRESVRALRERQTALTNELLSPSGGRKGSRDSSSPLGGGPWTPRRLKHLIREIDVRAGSRADLRLLSVSIHHGVIPRASLTDRESRAEDFRNYKFVSAGDVVINRMRAFEGGAGISAHDGIVSTDYAVLRCMDELSPRYFHYLIRSHWFIAQMSVRLRGIGNAEVGNVRTPRINVEDLGQIRVPLPSTGVQERIVAVLDAEAARVSQLTRARERQIALLHERRQALITAAVTGQLEIPGVAA